MALEFRPPEWLIRDYMNQPTDLDKANQLLQTLNQNAAQMIDQYQKNKQMKMDNETRRLGMLKDYAAARADLGAQADKIYAPLLGANEVNPSSPTASGAGLSLVDEIERLRKDPLGYRNQYGNKQADKVEKGYEVQQKYADRPLIDPMTGKTIANIPYNAEMRPLSAANSPKSLEQILAEKVASGEMTIDEALAKKAEGSGLIAGATGTAKNKVQLEKERPAATASLKATLHEYDNMISEAEAIKNDPSLGIATGATSASSIIPGTGAKRVAARLDTLKSKTLLNVLSTLKELSTTGASGFGQLSNIEGENLRNSISTLDRGLATKDFLSSLDRFISEMRQRRQGLKTKFDETYGQDGSSGPTPSDPGSFSDPTKEARYQEWKASQGR